MSDTNTLTSLMASADRELRFMLRATGQFMNEEQLETYIRKSSRFDKMPVSVTTEYSTIEVDHYFLRQDMDDMPAFFEAARAHGVDLEKANTLLLRLLDAYEYNTKHGEHTSIALTTKVLNALSETGTVFSQSEFERFLKLAKEAGEITRALHILKMLIEARLDLTQSIDVVRRLYEGPGYIGYTLMYAFDEIDALKSHDLPSDLFHEALCILADKGMRFADFTDVLHITSTSTALSQSDAFEVFIQSSKLAKTEREVMNIFADKVLPKADSPRFVKERETYFPEIPGNRLIHGLLPYRMTRSFADGINDLNRMMLNDGVEGAWVYDNDLSVWYSLGGRTKRKEGGLRHEFLPFDLSKLSSEPVFVHLHPVHTQYLIAPDRDTLKVREIQQRLTDFLTAMPSGADFELINQLHKECSTQVPIKALIITSQGITEFEAPDDIDRIADMKDNLRHLKAHVISELDQVWAAGEFGTRGQSPEFVRMMRNKLLDIMPPGFKIDLSTLNGYLRRITTDSDLGGRHPI